MDVRRKLSFSHRVSHIHPKSAFYNTRIIIRTEPDITSTLTEDLWDIHIVDFGKLEANSGYFKQQSSKTPDIYKYVAGEKVNGFVEDHSFYGIETEMFKIYKTWLETGVLDLLYDQTNSQAAEITLKELAENRSRVSLARSLNPLNDTEYHEALVREALERSPPLQQGALDLALMEPLLIYGGSNRTMTAWLVSFFIDGGHVLAPRTRVPKSVLQSWVRALEGNVVDVMSSDSEEDDNGPPTPTPAPRLSSVLLEYIEDRGDNSDASTVTIGSAYCRLERYVGDC